MVLHREREEFHHRCLKTRMETRTELHVSGLGAADREGGTGVVTNLNTRFPEVLGTGERVAIGESTASASVSWNETTSEKSSE